MIRGRAAMTGGVPAGTQLDYDLYLDAGFASVWGDTFGVDTSFPHAGAFPAAVNITVFGEIPLGQSPNPGAFQDTVTAVVFF